MNWMLIIVVLIFLVSIIRGWRRGLLRLLFSLVSIIVLIVLISRLNPYISSFLMNNTGIYERIEAWTADRMENRLGLGLEFLANSTSELTADLILKGLSFLIALIAAVIVVMIIFKVIGLIDRVPVVKGINRVLGLVGGAVEGYIIVCLLLLLVSMIAGTNLGMTLTDNIENNTFLSFLYQNNILLRLNLFR